MDEILKQLIRGHGACAEKVGGRWRCYAERALLLSLEWDEVLRRILEGTCNELYVFFLVRYLHSFQHSSIPASNSDWRTAVPCSRPCTLFLPYTQTTLLLQLCLHCRPPTFGSSALHLVLFIAALLSVPSGIPVRVVFPFSLSELIEAPVYIGFVCQPCPNLAPNPNKTHCHVNNQRIIS